MKRILTIIAAALVLTIVALAGSLTFATAANADDPIFSISGTATGITAYHDGIYQMVGSWSDPSTPNVIGRYVGTLNVRPGYSTDYTTCPDLLEGCQSPAFNTKCNIVDG